MSETALITAGEGGKTGAKKALGLVLAGSLAMQISLAISSMLFDRLSPQAVTSLRFLVAAPLLLVLFQPWRRRWTWQSLRPALAFGACIAAMNTCMYLAIDRIPLGVAMTIDFIGPCTVAWWMAKRTKDKLWAILALVGVALIAAEWGSFDPLGILFACGSASLMAVYTLLTAKMGTGGSGLQGVTISIVVAALVCSPAGLPHIGQVTPSMVLILVVSAFLGVVITYSADAIAGGVSSPRVVGTLFALDPVVGSCVGAILLHQYLALHVVAGILLVIFAGAALVWTSEEDIAEGIAETAEVV